MKRCQNKLDILRRSDSGQSGLSRSHLALSVLVASVWLGAGLLPVAAQQGEPVNLLSIAPAPADSGEVAVNRPLDIDQAIDKTLAVDDAKKLTTNPTTIAKPADQAIDPPTELFLNELQPTVSPAAKQVETDLPAEATANQTAPKGGLGANDVYGSAKIGRRNISDVGLAAIGVGDTGNRSEERRVGKECRSRWSPYH